MEPSSLYLASFGLGTTFVLLVLLRVGQRLALPAKPAAKAAEKGEGDAPPADLTPPPSNAARHLLQVGQLLSVFLVAAYTVKGCLEGADIKRDLARVAAFSIAALVLVIATGRLGVQLLFRSRLPAEIERGNTAAGLAAGALYAATGIITSRALVGGTVRDLGLSLTFFVLAQITFYAFTTLFRVLTTYDDSEQIQGENMAAALSYSGLSIGVAILVARAVEGDFVSWGVSLKGYAMVLLYLFALYPVRQILVQAVLLGAPFTLRGGRLDVGVGAERDEGLGALEAVTYVATALAISSYL